jgi:hypothetical protein
LPALLRELVAGGAPLRLSADQAARVLRGAQPAGLVALEREARAGDLLSDIRRLDRELTAIKARIAKAVALSQTNLLELHGVGPIVAGLILGPNRPGELGGSVPWKRGWSHARRTGAREADDASVFGSGEGSGGAVGASAPC